MIHDDHLPVSLDTLVSQRRRTQLAKFTAAGPVWPIEQAMREVLHAYICRRRIVRDGVTVPRNTKETRHAS